MDTFHEDDDEIVRLLREAAQRAEDDHPMPPFDPAGFEALSEDRDGAIDHVFSCPPFRRHTPDRCRRRR